MGMIEKDLYAFAVTRKRFETFKKNIKEMDVFWVKQYEELGKGRTLTMIERKYRVKKKYPHLIVAECMSDGRKRDLHLTYNQILSDKNINYSRKDPYTKIRLEEGVL